MVEQTVIRTLDEFFGVAMREPMFAASSALKFFTVWVCVLAMFHRVTYKYVNLLVLVWVVLVFSLYLSFVSPGYYAFEEYVLVGSAKLWVDVMFHWLPAAAITWLYWRVYRRVGVSTFATSNAFLVFLVYILAFDVREIYKIERVEDLVVLFVAVIVAYLAIFRP